MKIVDNLQVFIDDIHIRYEDHIHNVSFGITIDKIHMQSVNEDWEQVMIDVGQKIMRKLLEIKNLAIYLNPTVDTIQYTDANDFVDKMKLYIKKEESDSAKPNNYIIKPLNGTMKLDVNMEQKRFIKTKSESSIFYWKS